MMALVLPGCKGKRGSGVECARHLPYITVQVCTEREARDLHCFGQIRVSVVGDTGMSEVVPVYDTAANRSGVVPAVLVRKGQTIDTLDIFLATHALALDRTLVTSNERHFKLVPELMTENWI